MQQMLLLRKDARLLIIVLSASVGTSSSHICFSTCSILFTSSSTSLCVSPCECWRRYGGARVLREWVGPSRFPAEKRICSAHWKCCGTVTAPRDVTRSMRMLVSRVLYGQQIVMIEVMHLPVEAPRGGGKQRCGAQIILLPATESNSQAPALLALFRAPADRR